jgi:ubiquinone/menaquinone biosynthesis C-methylase UbiE
MPSSLRRNALLLVAVILGLASLYVSFSLTTEAPPPRVHALTGREIAQVSSDARWLDRNTREQEEAPDMALALLGIQRGMVVADVGAGTGYMTMRLAPLVGSEGRVYATDIQPAMLDIIRRKADAAKLTNVVIVQGTDRETGLPPGAIDLVLLVDVYHELSNPEAMLDGIRRALKPGGGLVLIEYRKEDPGVPIASTHRMSVADARAEVEARGLQFERLVSDLPRQHVIVFRKPGAESLRSFYGEQR